LDHISVLSKGLSFVPTYKRISHKTLDNQINKFERKLQLHYFFHNKSVTQTLHKPKDSLFTTNNNWWPHKLNGNITTFCYNLKKEIFALLRKPCRINNISKKEQDSLIDLKTDPNIVIKKADKNAGIVIMNKTDYEHKILSMLNDINTYTEINEDDSSSVKLQANRLLYSLKQQKYIDKKQYNHLTNYQVTCPIFYGIPKLHKPDIPLRPIVSQINSATYTINKYVHELLQVAESEIPYLFKDTTAFLNTIEKHKHVQPNTILVTLDVVSLYTNIPHHEAIRYICDQYSRTLHLWNRYNIKIIPVSIETLEQLLTFILSNCTFKFNNKFYKQNYGLPMGAPAAVRIANIFMYKHLQHFSNTYNKALPEFFGRLIDDIFFLWYYTQQELIELYNSLNNYHSTIKFEINYSTSKIHFLDVTLYNENNTLHTTVYTKPTDKKEFLHYDSNHPVHTKKAIPYSQAIRYRRIIDLDDNLTDLLNTLRNRFTRRNYPADVVDQQINKAKEIPRTDILQYKTNEQKHLAFTRYTNNKPFLPLIITYNHTYSTNNNLVKILKPLWYKMINSTDKLKNCFMHNFPKIVYSKGSTLSNTLIRADHSRSNNPDQNIINILAELLAENEESSDTAIHTCSQPLCKLCSIITCTNTFVSNTTKKLYHITHTMNCNSTNVIYLINCLKCGKQYVGETKRALRQRFNNHRSDIKLNKNTAVSIHFNDISHNLRHLTVIPIEFIDNESERKIRERFWMKELKTNYPHGLNNYPLIK